MGTPCSDLFRHPGVEEVGALPSGGIAVEEQPARRHTAAAFQLGNGAFERGAGPLFRFPVIAVAERGREQDQPVSIGQLIEAEAFQRVAALPVSSAEKDHDCLRRSGRQPVGEFDVVDSQSGGGDAEGRGAEEQKKDKKTKGAEDHSGTPQARAMVRAGSRTRSSGKMFFALGELAG